MAKSSPNRNEANRKVAIWQIVTLFLCIYVLVALFVDTVFRMPEETSILLNHIEYAVCILFIGDFVFNVITAKSQLGYLKWGWIDLVSSIPNLQILRWGRFIRIISSHRSKIPPRRSKDSSLLAGVMIPE